MVSDGATGRGLWGPCRLVIRTAASAPKARRIRWKGFCEGKGVPAGGTCRVLRRQGCCCGVFLPLPPSKHGQLTVLRAQQPYTGKCVTCGYAHQYDELLCQWISKATVRPLSPHFPPPPLFVHNSTPPTAKANTSSSSIRFRVRFLPLIYLTTSRAPEGYYGCLFCAHTGQVVTEGRLHRLRHVRRPLSSPGAENPQPLPALPDVMVLYGRDFALDSAEAAPSE